MESDSFCFGFNEVVQDFLFSSKDEDDQCHFYDTALENFKQFEYFEPGSPYFHDVDPLDFTEPTQPATPVKIGRSTCSLCQVEFVSSKGLMQHIAKIHNKVVKTVPCSRCDKYFKHKYALEFHVKQVHDKSTRVQCQVCFKVLYNKYAYRSHFNSKHAMN